MLVFQRKLFLIFFIITLVSTILPVGLVPAKADAQTTISAEIDLPSLAMTPKQETALKMGVSEMEIQAALDEGFTLQDVMELQPGKTGKGVTLLEALRQEKSVYLNRSTDERSTVRNFLQEDAPTLNGASAVHAAASEVPNYSVVITKPNEAPYSVALNREVASTLSGSLSLRSTDMTLPGRNGLGFALTRVYDSGDAQFYKMKGTDGENATETPYLEKLYPIGKGWTWDISSMEFNEGKRYAHLAGGGVYEVNDSMASLKGYPWLDLTFIPDKTVNTGTETSAYVLKSVRGTNQYFNTDGKLIRIADLYGNTIDFTYIDHSQYGKVLSKITDAIGNSISISYSESAVTITKGNETVSYQKGTYATKELLMQVVDPVGRVTTYDYDLKLAKFDLFDGMPKYPNPYALLSGVRHPTGAKTIYMYEDEPVNRIIGEHAVYQAFRLRSRMDQATSLNGISETRNSQTITYIGDMASAYKTDLEFSATVDDGLVRATFWNKKDYIDEQTAAPFYNTRILRQQVQGTLQQITEYTYDEAKRYTSPISTMVKWVDTQSNRESVPIRTSRTLDGYGDVLTATNPLNVTTIYTYSPDMHLLVSSTEPVSPTQTRYTEYVRNEKGSVLEVKQRDGGPTGLILGHVQYQNYDAYGNAWLTRFKDSDRDLVVQTQYGGQYQGAFPTTQTIEVRDISGNVSSINNMMAYNAFTGKVTSFTDGKGYTSHYTYDPLGRTIQAEYPDQSIIRIEYDDRLNQVKMTDETGVQTLTKWDPFGSLSADGFQEWGVFKAKQKAGYDAYGRLAWSEDAVGNRTRFEYDAWNRQIRTLYPDGAASRVEYDDIANTVTATDPEGNVSKNSLDLLGRLLQTELGGKLVASYAYDYLNNKTKFTDALSYTTSYDYDVLGRLTGVTNAKSEQTRYGYNMLGQMTTVTYADQTVMSKQYDELGRLLRTTDPLGQKQTYVYDLNGNLAQTTDRNGVSFTYGYDSRNRLRSNQAPDGNIAFQYDLSGRQTVMTDNTGTTTYEYHPATGTLVKVIYPDGRTLEYDYDETGNRRGMKDPFGGLVYYSYDSRSRLKTVGSSLDTSKADASYSYYGNNLLKQTIQSNGVIAEYGYDRLQLSTLTHKQTNGTIMGHYSYQYDDNHNQIGKVENGESFSFTYDPLNRITTSSQMGQTYQYDSRGNRSLLQTGENVESPNAQYQYDTRDRLKQATVENNQQVTYTYNGNGQLWERTENGETTRYYTDGAQVIAIASVVQGEAVLKERFIRGNALVAREDAQGKAFYLTNGHGDIVELRNEIGARLNRYSYDIWGNPAQTEEIVSQPFRYSGELWDKSSGLQYLRARWYDPSVGRFISKDTYEGDIANPLSLNLYTYVLNNPLKYIDPTGHANMVGMMGSVKSFV